MATMEDALTNPLENPQQNDFLSQVTVGADGEIVFPSTVSAMNERELQDMIPQVDMFGSVLPGPGAKKDFRHFSLPRLSSSQKDLLARANKYAMEQSIKNALVKQTIAHQQQQMENLKTTVQQQQALALLCRIYVGSINFEIKEDTIKQAFLPFGPIKSVNLSWDPITNKHKGFAFIEYEIPEAAQLSLEQMNGVMMGGRNIKVGRPSNMPQAQPIIEQMAAEAKSYNRIYVASIHTDLNENDIRSVFEAFGAIKVCQLAHDTTKPGRHRGYGFIEYGIQQSAVDAVSSMNLFDLGGQYLRVGKAITPPTINMIMQAPAVMPTASAVAAAAVTAKITAMEVKGETRSESPKPLPPPVGLAMPVLGPGGVIQPITIPMETPGTTMPAPTSGVSSPSLSTIPLPVATTSQSTVPPIAVVEPQKPVPQPVGPPELTETQKKLVEEEASQTLDQQENVMISGSNARHMMMQKLMRQQHESCVMVLCNMVGPEDLDEDLEAEVTEECGRYGSVKKVIVYQERQGEELDAEVIVKIFVEFTASSEMQKAVNALNGRFFGGRIVRARNYDQDMYEVNDLSG